MKIFTDLHHTDLAYSLYLLLEKRLKHQLFRPIGMEWFTEGYWKINDLEATARQYLEVGSKPDDGTNPLNDIYNDRNEYCEVHDPHNNYLQRAITLDVFKRTEFDVIIASVPQHVKPFQELIEKYQPKAKLVFQMGNHFDIHGLGIKNLMASTIPFPFCGNEVFYHQEFSTEVFSPSSDKPKKQIVSFINCLRQNGGMQNYYELKNLMWDYEFFSFGGQCDDGGISNTRDISQIMRESAFGFHCKWGADGYGHILHNFFACGTPVIVNYKDYKDKLGGKLLIPDETCIVAEIGDNMEKVAEKIHNLSPLQYEWMRQRTYDKFLETVDFEKDAEKVKKFLVRLT